MTEILDLSYGDTSGFDAVPANSYNCTVYEVTMEETSGQGKLPAGIPMVNVQFAVQDEEYANRRFFNRYPLPSPDQHERAAFMVGNFINLLVALGEDEQKIKTKGFNPEKLDDLVGRECVVRVGKELYKRSPEDEGDWTNPVKSVKKAGSSTSSGQKEGLL